MLQCHQSPHKIMFVLKIQVWMAMPIIWCWGVRFCRNLLGSSVHLSAGLSWWECWLEQDLHLIHHIWVLKWEYLWGFFLFCGLWFSGTWWWHVDVGIFLLREGFVGEMRKRSMQLHSKDQAKEGGQEAKPKPMSKVRFDLNWSSWHCCRSGNSSCKPTTPVGWTISECWDSSCTAEGIFGRI